MNSTLIGGDDAPLNNSTESVNCLYEEPPFTPLRFLMVTLFGSTVAFISVVENIFFFYLFATRIHHRQSFNSYMMYIAFFDVFVSAAYVLLMSMNVLADYLQSVVIMRIWNQYNMPMLTISHVAITSTSFLILAATFERFCITTNSKFTRWIQRNRIYLIIGSLVIGIISKGSIFAEILIEYNEECKNTLVEYGIRLAEFVVQDFVFGMNYHWFWRYWYRNIVTVFFPFFALLGLNAKIIVVLANYEKQNFEYSLSKTTAKQIKRKKITRAATRTTILVVCTYLISNIISVCLTTWETLDPDVQIGVKLKIYAVCVDLASLLTILACAFRPVIYLICQEPLRREVKMALHEIIKNSKEDSRLRANSSVIVEQLQSDDDNNNNRLSIPNAYNTQDRLSFDLSAYCEEDSTSHQDGLSGQIGQIFPAMAALMPFQNGQLSAAQGKLELSTPSSPSDELNIVPKVPREKQFVKFNLVNPNNGEDSFVTSTKKEFFNDMYSNLSADETLL